MCAGRRVVALTCWRACGRVCGHAACWRRVVGTPDSVGVCHAVEYSDAVRHADRCRGTGQSGLSTVGGVPGRRGVGKAGSGHADSLPTCRQGRQWLILRVGHADSVQLCGVDKADSRRGVRIPGMRVSEKQSACPRACRQGRQCRQSRQYTGVQDDGCRESVRRNTRQRAGERAGMRACVRFLDSGQAGGGKGDSVDKGDAWFPDSGGGGRASGNPTPEKPTGGLLVAGGWGAGVALDALSLGTIFLTVCR